MNIEINVVYSLEELSQILKISKRTLGHFIQAGELKPITFGNKHRFFGEEILRFLKEKERKNDE